ncbi:MAG TPA: FHA domain-containing protein, partial [Streptosporangiaceae bacterium]|nr:FHA domain-containing protein [Streptosporangiaceae bacterium]
MPPEHFDWSDRQAPQPGPAQAGLAEAAPPHAAPAHAAPPPPAGAPGPGPEVIADLVVRTRRSVHQFQGGTTYRIGRDPKSDIVMTDSRISWHHGVLRLDGNAWVLEDLGSTNGTFLGPQRLDRVDISNECIVRLGNPDDGPILRCTP